MAPVTEFTHLPLKTGATPADANSPSGSIWQDTLSTILNQPGAQRAYWGLEVEKPSTLHLFVDWESIDHHKKFMESEYELANLTAMWELAASLSGYMLTRSQRIQSFRRASRKDHGRRSIHPPRHDDTAPS